MKEKGPQTKRKEKSLASTKEIKRRKDAEKLTVATKKTLEQQIRIYNTALSNTLDFNYIFDTQGRFLYANKPLLDFWNKSQEEVYGLHFKDLGYPPELISLHESQLREVKKTKKPVRGENAFTNELGETSYYEYTFVPVLNSKGIVEAIVGTTHDVTERVKKSDSIASYHTALVTSSEDAIITKNLNGIINSWNKAAEEILGHTAEEAIGKPITLIIPDRLIDEEKEIIAKIRRGERIAHHETIRRRKDGSELDVSLSISPIKNAAGVIIGAAKILRNISEQKKYERKLKESENRFRTLADNIPNLAWIADKNGNISWFNNRWYEYTGTIKEQMLGREWHSVLDPTELPKIMAYWEHALWVGESFEIIFSIRSSAGRFGKFLTRVVPVHGENNEIINWFGTNTDITKQIESELSLKESQDKLAFIADASKILASTLEYRDVLKHMADLAVPRFADFCVFDVLVDNRIERVIWQHADESLRDYISIVDTFTPSIEFTSNPVANSLKYAHPTYIPVVTEEWLKTAATSPEHLAFQRKLGYTSIITVPLKIRNKVNGVLTFIYTAYSNRYYSEADVRIAEELATRAALAIENSQLYENMLASEERLRLALEAGEIGVWDWDIKRNKIIWSDKVYDFYGTNRNEFEVTFENFARQIHPDDRKLAEDAIVKAVEGKQEYDIEYRIITLDGEIKWISSRALVTRDSEGNALRMLGATSDVTLQKKIEQDKNDFISIATHELKTPVTSIKAYAQVLQKKFLRSGDLDSAAQLAKMDTQLDKLTSLIGDLLDATKIESGQLQMHPEEFDFNLLVKEIVEELQRTTEKHTLLIQSNPSIYIFADRERVGQVLTNYISNAIKYSPNAHDIFIRTGIKNKTLRFEVEDFGVGIPKEKQSHVFERFYRVSGPKGITFPGLGLGLFISSEIIKRQGGTIGVISEEGKGSTFYFTLPAVRPNPKKHE